MKTKLYFFRLIIALIALVIGLGVYRLVEHYQQSFEEQETCLTQPYYFVPDKTPELSANDSVKTDSQDSEFYPDGEYYPNEEDLVDGFRNLEELTIEANDWANAEDYNKPQPILPKGTLKAGKSYKFAKISINNRIISFETENKKGVSYSFIGEFPKEQSDGDEWLVGISGFLRKFRDGKQVAKIKINFYVGGC